MTLKVDVHTPSGKKDGTVELPAALFDVEPNIALMHQVVTAQLAAARQGTHSTKTRGEVSGGGKKPYRQKGTGRARQGSLRASQFRGGQTVHGPVVRSHAHDLPKKVRKLGLKCALSAKAKAGQLIVLDTAATDDAKTKALAAKFAKLGWQSVLVIDGPELNEGFARAARNIPKVDVLPQQGANVYDILRRDTLVLTRGAVEHLEARLK